MFVYIYNDNSKRSAATNSNSYNSHTEYTKSISQLITANFKLLACHVAPYTNISSFCTCFHPSAPSESTYVRYREYIQIRNISLRAENDRRKERQIVTQGITKCNNCRRVCDKLL